jgi:hypothetical protein
MLPGKRTNDGAIYIAQGPPPAGTPLVGGIAVSHTGVIYVSQSFVQPFTPADLFKLGEQGAWYDPSDFSTMFQYSSGTTPVTAVGQQVGLILDKSKGLVLGADLVNDDLTTWTKGGTSTTPSSTTATFPALNDYIWTSPGFSVGAALEATLTVSGSGTLWVGTYDSVGAFSNTSFNIPLTGTPTTHKVTLKFGTGGADRRFGFGRIGTATATAVTATNIIVKEIAGNHASQATAAACPLYKTTGLAKWNDFDAVDDVLNTTFLSSLGSSCTVGRANVGSAATILTAQTIGTSYANSTDNAGLVIVNRALTTQETTDLTAWLTAKGATT